MRSSVKLPAANDNLIDRTRRVWQTRLGRDLSREDARQIAENVAGFFAILGEWSRVEILIPTNDNGAFGPAPREAKGERPSRGDDNPRGERCHD